MKKKILVIGATGLIGQAVAKRLFADGFHVVVMSRSKEKASQVFSKEFEIVVADALQEDTLKYAFEGIDGMYISLPEKEVPSALPNILKFAKDARVKHVIYNSGCTVREENAWHPMIKGHFEGERLIREGGLDYTLFKLTMVMDMIPRYANNGKAFIIGKQLQPWSWIYSGDIARMASAAFSKEEAKNKEFTIFGTEKMSIPEAVQAYNDVHFPSAKKVKSTSYSLARVIALFAGGQLKYAISIFKYFEHHPEEGDPSEAYRILGRPSMDINTFIKEN